LSLAINKECVLGKRRGGPRLGKRYLIAVDSLDYF